MMADQSNSELAKAGASAKMRDLMRELDGLGVKYLHISDIEDEPDSCIVVFEHGDYEYAVSPAIVLPGSLRVRTSQVVYAKTPADVLELAGLGAEP